MVLSGLELGFFVKKYASYGSATGTFVNRNHFAGYLVLCSAAGIALLLSDRTRYAWSSRRDALRSLLGFLLSPTFRWRAFLALIIVGLILSRSRITCPSCAKYWK